MTDSRLFVPALSESELVQQLRVSNLVLGELPDRIHLLCPTCLQEATYRFPTATDIFGTYRCKGDCSCASVFELLKYFHLHEIDALVMPKVFLRAGDTATIVEILTKELQATELFFQFGGCLSKIEKTGREFRLSTMNEPALFLELASRFRFFKFDARSNRFLPADVPERIISTLLKAKLKSFPKVLSLTNQPTISEAGELCLKTGYSKESQLYGAFSESDFEDLDREISRSEAQASMDFLLSLIDEVPFASDTDIFATVSAMMTAVFRPCFVAAPFIFVNALDSSSGKTTLCDALVRLSTLGDVEKIIFHKDDGEFDRTLFSALRTTPGAVYFDNVTVDIRPIASFCTLLTHGQFAGRVIRTSDVETVQVRSLIVGNGNNIAILQDMIRRTLVIQLEAINSSTLRVFNKPSLFEYLRDHRNEVIKHVLVIVKAWFDAGRPQIANPLSSFQHWDACCRAPVLWLSGVDPLTRMLEAFEKAKPSRSHSRLLQILFESFDVRVFAVSDITKRVTPELEEELKNLGFFDEHGVNTRKVGKWLTHHAGSSLGGLRLVAVSPGQKIKKYRIEGMSNG